MLRVSRTSSFYGNQNKVMYHGKGVVFYVFVSCCLVCCSTFSCLTNVRCSLWQWCHCERLSMLSRNESCSIRPLSVRSLQTDWFLGSCNLSSLDHSPTEAESVWCVSVQSSSRIVYAALQAPLGQICIHEVGKLSNQAWLSLSNYYHY